MAKPKKAEMPNSFVKRSKHETSQHDCKKDVPQSSILKMPPKYWSGGFSKVRAHTHYVIKVLKKKGPHLLDDWINEVKALNACSSILGVPRLLSFSANMEESDYRIKMTRCRNAYPLDYLYKHIAIDESTIITIISKTINIIEKIHATGFVHYDVTLANILFNPFDESVHLIDFGFCTNGPLSKFYGTDAYVAPELTDKSIPYPKGDAKCDVYGAGVCLYFLICMCFDLYQKNTLTNTPFPWIRPGNTLSPTMAFLTQLTEQMLRPQKQRPNATAVAANLRAHVL